MRWFVINKDEILAKSRKENRVEENRKIQILASSLNIAKGVGLILLAIIVVISEIVNKPLLGLSAWAAYLLLNISCTFLLLFLYNKKKRGDIYE